MVIQVHFCKKLCLLYLLALLKFRLNFKLYLVSKLRYMSVKFPNFFIFLLDVFVFGSNFVCVKPCHLFIAEVCLFFQFLKLLLNLKSQPSICLGINSIFFSDDFKKEIFSVELMKGFPYDERVGFNFAQSLQQVLGIHINELDSFLYKFKFACLLLMLSSSLILVYKLSFYFAWLARTFLQPSFTSDTLAFKMGMNFSGRPSEISKNLTSISLNLSPSFSLRYNCSRSYWISFSHEVLRSPQILI